MVLLTIKGNYARLWRREGIKMNKTALLFLGNIQYKKKGSKHNSICSKGWCKINV